MFRSYQSNVAQAYLNGEADLSDTAQAQKLYEELFAYLSGDIHEGINDDALRPMFRDYDAVKAAWEEFISSTKTGIETQSAADTEKMDGGDDWNQIRTRSLSPEPFMEGFLEDADLSSLAKSLRKNRGRSQRKTKAEPRARTDAFLEGLMDGDTEPMQADRRRAEKSGEELFRALYQEYLLRMTKDNR